MIRKYEIAFLIKEGEIAKAAVERIREYFKKLKAGIINESDMGTRQLAYQIHRNREDFRKAYYHIVRIEMDTKKIPEFERLVKFDEDIIRHMLLAGE
jgi:small subunit ribosomal protein S6